MNLNIIELVAAIAIIAWLYVQGKHLLAWLIIGKSDQEVAKLKESETAIKAKLDATNSAIAAIPAQEAAKSDAETESELQKNLGN